MGNIERSPEPMPRSLVRKLAAQDPAEAAQRIIALQDEVYRLHADGPLVPTRLLDDVRVSMKALLEQHVNAWAEVERLHEHLRAADCYIEHLRTNRGHGECRRQTGPGRYECGYRLDWLAGRVTEQRP